MTLTLDPTVILTALTGLIGLIAVAVRTFYKLKKETNNTLNEIKSENRLEKENERLHTRLEAEIDKNARLVARINELGDIASNLQSQVTIADAEKRFLERDLASTERKLEKADGKLTDEERGEVWKNTRPVQEHLRIAPPPAIPNAPYVYPVKK